jgi:chromosome segregation ATPase
MAGTQWLLEIALIGLLAATLFHALRLERALGVVRRDRAELETLVRSFNDSTRQAESGVEKLRSAADGVGRHISRQIEAATALKDDLGHLVERGERLADQMDAPARRAPTPEPETAALAGPRMRSQAERDLLRALRVTR